MPYSKPRFSSAFFTKLLVFIGLSLSWSVVLLFFGARWQHFYIGLPLFGLFTGIMTFWFLDGLDYFVSYDPLPKPDALITLAVIVPIAGIISKYLLVLTLNIVFIRYRDILLATPAVCLIAFFCQTMGGMRFVKSGKKRKIFFLTTEAEAKKVLRALRSKLLLKYYEPIFGNDLEKVPAEDEITAVVISRSEIFRFEKRENVIEAMISGQEIVDYREMTAKLRGHLDIDSLDLWMFLNQSVHKNTSGRIYYTSKTVVERILSTLLLLLLSPLFVLVAMITKLTSQGPIFYGQTRLGYHGLEFKLWKFRSMRNDAELTGPQFSKMGDARITPFGGFLRKTRIDEFPQLWNVIRGEMSLIGPRPERPEFYNEFEKELPIFRFRLLVPPGITGWAQVMGGYAASFAQMKRKLEYDLFYLQRMSPKMDLHIAIKTTTVAMKSLFRSSAK
jgi:lipopolysaccharide/colanic/teichoic acid biosynthesis glycosyltransferase